jgi:hypothetical protein
MNKWTQSEIDVLAEIYPTLGSIKTAEIIGKTRRSVIDMAYRNNIKYKKPIKDKIEKDIKRRHRWTENERTFLSENYYEIGGKMCSSHLNIEVGAVEGMAHRIGLVQSPKLISESHRMATLGIPKGSKRVSVDVFEKCATPDIAYVLGFLWADGFFLRKTYKIAVNIMESDFNDIHDVFSRNINWYCAHREKRKQSSPQANMEVNDLATFNFLADYGYKTGRIMSPDEIIRHVGHFAPYWFRGYFDGDGCFYYHEKEKTRHITFAGSFDQDWSFIDSILRHLNIEKYKINKRHIGKYKFSTVRAWRHADIVKFGNYIYGDAYDGIGLKRKHSKFLQIVSSATRLSKERDI